jgi:hypothetical protein
LHGLGHSTRPAAAGLQYSLCALPAFLAQNIHILMQMNMQFEAFV